MERTAAVRGRLRLREPRYHLRAGPTFYHTSQHASANLVWQRRQRLSVGFEGLYGIKEARNGEDSGDHWRLQIGMVYSLFD